MDKSPISLVEFDWHGATDPSQYASVVRSAFGSGGASSAEVATHLIPPMLSLECLQIEITTWCNFACQQCSRTKATALGQWQNQHISLETCRTIIAKLPPTRQIYLQGVGEPSMHPHFFEMLKLVGDSGKFQSIHFNTNGHTHDDAYWQSLAQFPGITVALSVDSLDPTVATICRAGTDADLLWHRLKLFRETFTWFIVALVASRLNLRDIETTLRKIATLGNVPVQITRMNSDDASVVLSPEDDVWLAERVAAVQRDFPDFSLYFNAHNSGFPPNEKRCVSPFLTPYVRADGKLTPCCAAVSASHYGHLSADDDCSWDELRASPQLVDWVANFVKADPEVCQGCSLNPNQVTRIKKSAMDV